MANKLSITTPKLKVVFTKSTDVDRWSHQVLLTANDQQHVLLTSIEGDNQQTWPPSAPLQDVSHHDLSGNEAILGVGMAGKSHWSASVSTEANETSEDNAAIFFDMACLIKTPDPSVGSKYTLGPGVFAQTDGDDMRLRVNNTDVTLRPHRGLGQETRVQIAGDGTLEISPAGLSNPSNPSPETRSESTRWCFHLYG